MDWQTLAMAWGPAVPVLVVLLKAHWDLVYKAIPEGFAKSRRLSLRLAREARRRHKEHIAIQKEIRDAVQRGACRHEKKEPGTKKRRAT